MANGEPWATALKEAGYDQRVHGLDAATFIRQLAGRRALATDSTPREDQP